MHRIWIGLAFAIVIAKPVSAQDYRRNFVECANELGLQPDANYTHRLQPEAGGRVLRRWFFHSEAQQTVFNDCVARKASLAPKPSARGPLRVPR